MNRPDMFLGTTSFRPVPWSKLEMLVAVLTSMVLVVLPVGALHLVTGVWAMEEAQIAALRGPVLALAELLLIVPPYVVVRRHGQGWAWLGFRRYRLLPALTLGCLFIGVSFLINLFWSLFLKYFGWQGQPNYMPLFGNGAPALAWALIAGAFVAPLAEETFFRGFLFAGLREQFGLAGGVLLSAILFALVHVTPAAIVPIFVLGVLFALLYEATDSIWPGVALHSIINTLALIASFLALRQA